jgi:hypothetical protein
MVLKPNVVSSKELAASDFFFVLNNIPTSLLSESQSIAIDLSIVHINNTSFELIGHRPATQCYLFLISPYSYFALSLFRLRIPDGSFHETRGQFICTGNSTEMKT